MGAVLSILIWEKVAVAELPARSVQVPLADWPSPSPALVTSAGADGTPEPAPSSQVKLTRTLLFVQVFFV